MKYSSITLINPIKKLLPKLLPVLLATTTVTTFANETETQIRQQQAMSLVKTFAGQLKPKLQQAMNKGGPLHAITVCAKEAPEIASRLSAESGWTIKRVSTRNRNPNAIPDEWELKVIQSFEKQLEEGADPATLNFGEDTNSGYRFAKAQITEPLCLTCHGQAMAPEVAKTLEKYYPGDKATGYDLGQIRGIFSLAYPLR